MNESISALYRHLPSVDRLLSEPAIIELSQRYGHALVTTSLRALLEEARNDIKKHGALRDWTQDWSQALKHRLEKRSGLAMRPVFNLTGIVLHTNLGRARQADAAIEAVAMVMREAVTLEYDLAQAGRGHRDANVSALLQEITGAEAACVVNNNAAGVLLMFAAMADGAEAIASRGELVEIGGSFRIPDVMRQAGCRLVEVGTTNRTHLRDYREAITEKTALMVKVHTSNYRIEGFTSSVSEEDLAALGKEVGIPVASDLGSGALIDLGAYGLSAEAMPQQMLKAGVDLVSFSGDKLLGGPQAGIVVGRAEYIEILQKHPLKRALRCDKMTLAALEATLRLYLRTDQLQDLLPTLRYLTRTQQAIRADAEQLLPVCCTLFDQHFLVSSEGCASQIGSGSLPLDTLPSWALTFTARDGSGRTLERLAEYWHNLPQPVIGRITDRRLWLDLRCLDSTDALAEVLKAAPLPEDF